jgi:hypothetical protein
MKKSNAILMAVIGLLALPALADVVSPNTATVTGDEAKQLWEKIETATGQTPREFTRFPNRHGVEVSAPAQVTCFQYDGSSEITCQVTVSH